MVYLPIIIIYQLSDEIRDTLGRLSVSASSAPEAVSPCPSPARRMLRWMMFLSEYGICMNMYGICMNMYEYVWNMYEYVDIINIYLVDFLY